MRGTDGDDWKIKQLPDPADLYNYLERGFDRLDSNSDNIPNGTGELRNSIGSAYRDIKGQSETDWSLQISPYLPFDVRSKRDFASELGQLRIGANIQVVECEYIMFSCDLIILVKHPTSEDQDLPEKLRQCCIKTAAAESTAGNIHHVLERIHWDIDTGSDVHEIKPVCHMQLGGEMSDDAFHDWEEYHYCSNGLDKPRIPHPPMGPLLILNLITKQYESMEPFRQSTWRGIVREGEDTLWGPYYEAANGMLGTDESIMNLMNGILL